MSKNTSISLGSHFERFIQSRIKTGRYNNVSEVVRAGLRLLEEEESRLIALRKAIKDGMDSDLVEDFDPEAHLAALKSKRK